MKTKHFSKHVAWLLAIAMTFALLPQGIIHAQVTTSAPQLSAGPNATENRLLFSEAQVDTFDVTFDIEFIDMPGQFDMQFGLLEGAVEHFTPNADIRSATLGGQALTIEPQMWTPSMTITFARPASLGGDIMVPVKNLTITGRAEIGSPLIVYVTPENSGARVDFFDTLTVSTRQDYFGWDNTRPLYRTLSGLHPQTALNTVNIGTVQPGENLLYARVTYGNYYQIYTISIVGLVDPNGPSAIDSSDADRLFWAHGVPTVTVSDVDSLRRAIFDSTPDTIIGVAGGDYFAYANSSFNSRLAFRGNALGRNNHDIILRSVSGNFHDVTIRGEGFHKEPRQGDVTPQSWADWQTGDIGGRTIRGRYGTPSNELLEARDGSTGITWYGLTIRDSNANGFKVDGSNEANILIDNCRSIDINERHLKGSGHTGMYTHNLIVRNSWFENTQHPRYRANEDHVLRPGQYTAGFDVMNLRGGLIQNNIFMNIQGAPVAYGEGPSTGGGAMYFWGPAGSTDIIIENNFIFNTDRGITFGLWGSFVHRGIIRNNIIYGASADAIEFTDNEDIQIYNNTIIMNERNRFNRGIRDTQRNSRDVIIRNNIVHQLQLWMPEHNPPVNAPWQYGRRANALTAIELGHVLTNNIDLYGRIYDIAPDTTAADLGAIEPVGARIDLDTFFAGFEGGRPSGSNLVYIPSLPGDGWMAGQPYWTSEMRAGQSVADWDPIFAEDFMLNDNATTRGYVIQHGVALPILVDTDFWGNPRGGHPDIGAHQLSAPTDDLPAPTRSHVRIADVYMNTSYVDWDGGNSVTTRVTFTDRILTANYADWNHNEIFLRSVETNERISTGIVSVRILSNDMVEFIVSTDVSHFDNVGAVELVITQNANLFDPAARYIMDARTVNRVTLQPPTPTAMAFDHISLVVENADARNGLIHAYVTFTVPIDISEVTVSNNHMPGVSLLVGEWHSLHNQASAWEQIAPDIVRFSWVNGGPHNDVWGIVGDGTDGRPSWEQIQAGQVPIFIAFRGSAANPNQHNIRNGAPGNSIPFTNAHLNVLATIPGQHIAFPQPTLPLNFAVSAGPGSAALSWDAPASTGGRPVLHYQVSYDNGFSWVESSHRYAHTFADLYSMYYTFLVRAVTSLVAGVPAQYVVFIDGTTHVAVTGISIAQGNSNVPIGDTLQLDAIVMPTNASNQLITWQSSNTNIAMVDAYGLVSSIGPGTAIITTNTVEGGFSDSITIAVPNLTPANLTIQDIVFFVDEVAADPSQTGGRIYAEVTFGAPVDISAMLANNVRLILHNSPHDSWHTMDNTSRGVTRVAPNVLRFAFNNGNNNPYWGIQGDGSDGRATWMQIIDGNTAGIHLSVFFVGSAGNPWNTHGHGLRHGAQSHNILFLNQTSSIHARGNNLVFPEGMHPQSASHHIQPMATLGFGLGHSNIPPMTNSIAPALNTNARPNPNVPGFTMLNGGIFQVRDDSSFAELDAEVDPDTEGQYRFSMKYRFNLNASPITYSVWIMREDGTLVQEANGLNLTSHESFETAWGMIFYATNAGAYIINNFRYGKNLPHNPPEYDPGGIIPQIFGFNIFNNGPDGSPSTPNASLAAAGIIRMWAQLDDVNAPVYFDAADTIIALDQNGQCAMEFVRVNRIWTAGTGWADYFNSIDVNKNGKWQYINLSITVYGQTVHVLLVNALFEPPVLPVFGWNIFNNGPGGAPSRPNASLAAAGTIRMWAQLDGVNSPVYLDAADTIVALDQDGECAMQFVRVNRMWTAGSGWTNYFNLVDVNKSNGSWQYINLYITVYGQTMHALLVNALFVPPVVVPQIVGVVPNPAVLEQGSTVEIVVTTQGMPDGAWVDLNVTWRPGLSIVGGPRFYIVDNQAIITVAANANARLGRDGFAVTARTAGDWGSVVIIDSYLFVIEVA